MSDGGENEMEHSFTGGWYFIILKSFRSTFGLFGLTCSGDVFQEKMDSVFGSLDGVTGIADDTFIYGSSEASHESTY